MDVLFYVNYKKSKVGTAPSSAPTLALCRVNRSTGVESVAVAAGTAMTASLLSGRYYYRLTGADLDVYDYHGRSTTSDTTVDDREPDVLWTRWSEAAAGPVETVLARIGGLAGTGLNTLKGFLEALGSKDVAKPSGFLGGYQPAEDSLQQATDDALTAPNNFGAFLIDAAGFVSLATTPPTAAQILAAIRSYTPTFRDQTALAEAAVTVEDCWAAAWVETAGPEAVAGTAYTRKRQGGQAFRTFALDSATAPTTRS